MRVKNTFSTCHLIRCVRGTPARRRSFEVALLVIRFASCLANHKRNCVNELYSPSGRVGLSGPERVPSPAACASDPPAAREGKFKCATSKRRSSKRRSVLQVRPGPSAGWVIARADISDRNPSGLRQCLQLGTGQWCPANYATWFEARGTAETYAVDYGYHIGSDVVIVFLIRD